MAQITNIANEEELLESLQQISQKITISLPNLANIKESIAQAISCYKQLRQISDKTHITHSQLEEFARQSNELRKNFIANLQIMYFTFDQLLATVLPRNNKGILALQQKISQLEGLAHLHALMQTPQQPQDLAYLMDRVFSAQQEQLAWEQRSGKCLIIDDNLNDAESIQRRLAHEGYEVFCTHDPATAAKILEKNAMGVVLICLQAAQQEYSGLVEALLNKKFGYIPILVMGTLDQLNHLEAFLSKGGEDFLLKPLNANLLKNRVRFSLEKKEMYKLRQEKILASTQLHQELKGAINQLSDCFIAFDYQKRLLMNNNKIFQIFPFLAYYTHGQGQGLEGLSLDEWLEAILEAGMIDFSAYKGQALTLAKKNWFLQKLEAFNAPAISWEEKLISGQMLVITSYRTTDGGVVITIKNNTEHHAKKEQLNYMAFHDVLTGLANRQLFYTTLRQTIKAPKKKAAPFAILFMDLNNFKSINDTYGHEVGDWVLIQAAQRLRRCLRGGDIVARLGGDEFAALIHDVSQQKSVTLVLERILSTITAPFCYGNLNLRVSVSIGIATYPHDSTEPEGLLSKADAAMYAAKQEGTYNYCFYKQTIPCLGKQQPHSL